VSHGPLQGLIPDLVPEDQRSHASAVKSIMELLPVVLVGLTIAKMVGAGHLDAAIFVTGLALLVVTLITMIFVKETPPPGETDHAVLAAHAARVGDAGRHCHRSGGRVGGRRAGGGAGWSGHAGIREPVNRSFGGYRSGWRSGDARGSGGGRVGGLPGDLGTGCAQTTCVRLVESPTG